jgi:hypothetical protein
MTIKIIDEYKYPCKLYKGDVFILDFEHELQLLEIMVQIFEKYKNKEDSSGYYFIWNNNRIDISEKGRVKTQFDIFSDTDKYLRKLI